jgi:hypothetical protein
MCVTANAAEISNTKTFVHATTLPDGSARHVCGYQNQADNLVPFSGANCMFLNFAGTDLKLVQGPETTTQLMNDMTRGLLPLYTTRSASRGGGAFFDLATRGSEAWVEDYGDYTVVLARNADDILDTLSQVPFARRPAVTHQLKLMIDFYGETFPQDSFVLACFDGSVRPKHPIVVSYTPRNPNVLTIPGLDGHDGKRPVVEAPVHRGFKVAFAVEGLTLPRSVDYTDLDVASSWAPPTVTGFYDNRPEGPNGDYVIPVEAVRRGLAGKELAEQLIR